MQQSPELTVYYIAQNENLMALSGMRLFQLADCEFRDRIIKAIDRPSEVLV